MFNFPPFFENHLHLLSIDCEKLLANSCVLSFQIWFSLLLDMVLILQDPIYSDLNQEDKFSMGLRSFDILFQSNNFLMFSVFHDLTFVFVIGLLSWRTDYDESNLLESLFRVFLFPIDPLYSVFLRQRSVLCGNTLENWSSLRVFQTVILEHITAVKNFVWNFIYPSSSICTPNLLPPVIHYQHYL